MNMFFLILSTHLMAAPSMEKINDLGLHLLRESSAPRENAFLSPTSIQAALALTYEGSRGPVRQAGEKFLDASPQDWNLPRDMELGSEVHLQSANAIWTNSDNKNIQEPTPEFIKRAAENFEATIRRSSFAQADQLAKAINAWVKDQTEGMILDLVTGPQLKGNDAVIINAIYFKGPWQSEFNPRLTRLADFHVDDQTVETEFMQNSATFGYGENADFQMVDLPYRGSSLSMIVLLPRASRSLESLDVKLGAKKIDQWIKDMRPRRILLRLPKFEMTWGTTDITEALIKAGMPRRGDFTPLGISDFSIPLVVHKARVVVNEQGTEAAAATAVIGRSTGVPAKLTEVIADRPFLFLIRDNKTGAWLFIGRLYRPSNS